MNFFLFSIFFILAIVLLPYIYFSIKLKNPSRIIKPEYGKFAELKQGHAICFASFINHRVQPVTRGVRQSLVVWFGGKPFR